MATLGFSNILTASRNHMYQNIAIKLL